MRALGIAPDAWSNQTVLRTGVCMDPAGSTEGIRHAVFAAFVA